MRGTENLKELAKGLIELADLTSDVMEDGKINLGDIDQALRVPVIVSNFSGAGEALKEVADLDESELDSLKDEIGAYAESRIDDPASDKLENIVEDVLYAALYVARVFNNFKKEAA